PSGRISRTPSAKIWPSFSLWACRILKMRSCLRKPLAPGSSRVRAILVSSVMFFSFNSEIVMFTYGDFAERRVGGTAGNAPKARRRLCSAPLRFGGGLRFDDHILPFGIGDSVQHFVGGVLNACVGFVKLTRRLGCQLA